MYYFHYCSRLKSMNLSHCSTPTNPLPLPPMRYMYIHYTYTLTLWQQDCA